MNFLQKQIEALIFCASEPITLLEIQQCLTELLGTELPSEEIRGALLAIEERYSTDEFAFGISKSGGGFQFLTKPAFEPAVQVLLKQKSKKRLSTSALETIAIIAYKQPISKTNIEHIRGVNCDYAIQKLLEKELIEIKGKAETPGRPLLYGTSARFMEYFGINSLKDLPVPKDFAEDENSIGTDSENS